jgi:hypothetical protein
MKKGGWKNWLLTLNTAEVDAPTLSGKCTAFTNILTVL